MDAITQHHFHNIAYGKAKRMDNGDLATVNTIIKEIDGVETLIPTVWDGQIVDEETAVDFAVQSGIAWPTRTGENAVEELDAFDRDIHTAFSDKTSQEEAAGILIDNFGYPDPGTEMMVPGGKLILSNETFESGSPMWDFIANEPVESLLAPQTSERPEPRPSPEYFANKLLLQAQKDEDELYDYKAEQNQIEYDRVFGGKEPSMLAENEYNLGGIATARKGITTEEGVDMANKKYQRDDKAADTNKDDKLSTREKEIANAVQKNVDEDLLEDEKVMKAAHGGMACGCGGSCDGSCDMMGGIMGYDDVSGNAIPLGSNAENVRDDIDAKLSTDEYVLPAHVVKYHGLKHIQMMQAEAEMGLMSMKMEGLIQHVEEKSDSSGSEDTEVPSEDNPEQKDATAEAEASEEIYSPQGVDVEVAAFKVEDHLDNSDEIEEIEPEESSLPGMMKKKRYAFAV